MINYRVKHTTVYGYAEAPSSSYNLVHLTPRDSPGQRCRHSELSIHPTPESLTRYLDYFGNAVTSFAIYEPHERLTVTAISKVTLEVAERPEEASQPPASPRWEQVRDRLAAGHDVHTLGAFQFVFDSSYVKPGPKLEAYARRSFPPGRAILEAAMDLTLRIHRDFRYVPKATTVSTPVEEVLERRRGVCQDFAHSQIGCLRSMGLAARYVSGYLRTDPPAGRPRLLGADGSHAWVSVYAPEVGWIDFDPTNACIPNDRHVTLAWGRDFGDVSPVKGVVLGAGEHELQVSVDVMPA